MTSSEAATRAGGTADPRPSLIALWAVPRSRSTAVERMMMERGDLEVVHEPFSNLAATGSFTVAGRTATTMPELFDVLIRRSRQVPLFFKETTDYRYDEVLADDRLYTDVVNTFIVRTPPDVVSSHHAVNPQVTCDEIGFERLHEIFDRVRARTAETPAVIDADDLVTDPEQVVRAYCRRVGLEFLPETLRWEPGVRPEWQRTDRWHQQVADSQGLQPRTADYQVRPDNDPRLAELVRHHQPFFDALHAHRLTR